MLKYILVIFICIISINAYSQDTLTTLQAKNHIGDSAFVIGVVSGIHTSQKGNSYINFDEPYPNETFSIVLFSKDSIDISNIKVGSIVTVRGWIVSFNDKPQIILKKREQIVKVE